MTYTLREVLEYYFDRAPFSTWGEAFSIKQPDRKEAAIQFWLNTQKELLQAEQQLMKEANEASSRFAESLRKAVDKL